MTNAEKYLKDGVDVWKLANEIKKYSENTIQLMPFNIEEFFKQQVKPTLTKDERVILRNLHEEYKHIRRNEMGNLYIGVDYFGMYDNLFQFIKERRRIRDKGVIK